MVTDVSADNEIEPRQKSKNNRSRNSQVRTRSDNASKLRLITQTSRAKTTLKALLSALRTRRNF